MNHVLVTRFAPSPTGLLHLGNYRTAVFAYLFARKHGGKFVLRIEDTDRARSTKEYEDNILESLQWIGLEYDEFHRQSELVGKHRQFLEQVIAEGKAYVSKEEAKDGSGILKEVVRFKNPNKVVTFTDLIRGEISMDTTDLHDFVIAKNLDEPIFHFANVIDDYTMGITHIIRGEDHISNTPRQILIYEALGATPPTYAHLPLVLGEDRSKLSKRRGAKALTDYRDLGYLPQAMLNMMALIGWNPGTDQEIFSKEELVQHFDLAKVQKGSAIFNPEKLDWINREYIKKLTSDELFRSAEPFLPKLDIPWKFLEPVLRERIHCFNDIAQLFDTELRFLVAEPELDTSRIAWKKSTLEIAQNNIRDIIAALESLGDFSRQSLESKIAPIAESRGKGDVLWPMRYALTGQERSPDPFTCAELLGKETTIARLRRAV